MTAIIRLGDPTSQGGSVLEGDSTVLHAGQPMAIVGMQASCPKCSLGQGPIVAVGPRTVNLPGGPVALAGDIVACGCPPGSHILLAAQGNTNAGADSGRLHRATSENSLLSQATWIGFSLTASLDYKGIKCLATMDDGSVLKGQFDQENRIIFPTIPDASCVKLEIESFEREQEPQSLTNILLKTILG